MIQSHVKLEPISHTYSDVDGNQYTSVSRILDIVEDKFDVEAVSRVVAGKGKYAGMSQAEVKEQWRGTAKQSTDHGTRYHEALERYTKEFKILEEDEDLTPMVKSVCSEYVDYLRVYDEVCLYHPKYMAAGTADKILVVNARGGFVDIEDYKTNIKKGIEFHSKYNKYKKHPVSHLSDCNFNRYALQMSIYGVMYEFLTLNKVRSMWIRYIPPDDPINHRKIMVPYMKTDAIAILEHFNAMKLVESLKQSEFNDEIPELED